MRIVPIAEIKNNLADYVDKCKVEPVFVTRNGRVVAVLDHITDDGIEDFLLERSPRFRAALDKARRQRGGTSVGEYRKTRGV